MKCKLSDICEYRDGKVNISNLTLKTYISTENMLPDRAGIVEANSLPSTAFVKEFKENDILVSNIRPYFKKIWQAKYDGGCSNDVLVFKGKSNVDKDFLYYILANDDFFAYSMLTSKGTKMPRGDKKSIMQYEIQLFDIEIQKRIANILKVLDEKIELNNLINHNLEQQSVLIFKDWFTNLGNSDKDMLQTQFGLIPSSYKLMKNSDLPIVITDYVANGSFASLKANVTLYQDENYSYFIRNTDLKSGTYGVFVDKHSYEFLSKSKLFGGELIISNVGDVGSVYLCPKLNKPMTLGNNMILLRPEQENLNYYLYLWFKWGHGKSLIKGITGGSAQPKFNKTDFKNLLIYLPDDVLLERFHQLVKPMYKLIENNNFESQILIDIRNSLLPKLLSGEVDVSNIKL